MIWGLILFVSGAFFGFLGFYLGNRIIKKKLWLAYVIATLVFGLVTIYFIDINFPLPNSKWHTTGSEASMWIILVGLAGRFIFIGAIASENKKRPLDL